MKYDFFKTVPMELGKVPEWNIIQYASVATSEFGESLLNPQGRIACVRKYGYAVYERAKENYIWRSNPHHISEETRNRYNADLEKYKASHDGVATSNTLLEF